MFTCGSSGYLLNCIWLQLCLFLNKLQSRTFLHMNPVFHVTHLSGSPFSVVPSPVLLQISPFLVLQMVNTNRRRSLTGWRLCDSNSSNSDSLRTSIKWAEIDFSVSFLKCKIFLNEVIFFRFYMSERKWLRQSRSDLLGVNSALIRSDREVKERVSLAPLFECGEGRNEGMLWSQINPGGTR